MDECGIEYRLMEDLKNHTTFKIGGNADIFAVPHSIGELSFLLKTAGELSVRNFVLGRGSNVLFDDDGYEGMIISTENINYITIEGDTITAGCGATLNSVALAAKENSLTGMERIFGIPGSVGGAVYMNAGAYESEMSHIVTETSYFDADTYEIKKITGEDHRFGYRKSAFIENRGIVLETKLQLKHGDKDDIIEQMNEFKRRRLEKQPLEYPSAGSTFKRYPGRYTGKMIEEAGLKGYTVGGAQVSEKHAGFIINKGGATCSDVLTLMGHIIETIEVKFGITIETEVIYIK